MSFNLKSVSILIVALLILSVIKIDSYSAESTNYTPKYSTLAHKIISKEPIDVSREVAYRKLDMLIDSVRRLRKGINTGDGRQSRYLKLYTPSFWHRVMTIRAMII